MPSAKIVFVVPDDAAGLADIIYDNGGESDDIEGVDDPDSCAASLAERAGRLVEVTFETDDPTEPAYDLANAMDRAGTPYWAGYDAFEERSRGVRVPGRMLLNAGAGRRELPVTWEYGPPSLDARALRLAGLGPEEVSAVEAVLFDRPGAAPKGP